MDGGSVEPEVTFGSDRDVGVFLGWGGGCLLRCGFTSVKQGWVVLIEEKE